MMRKRGRTTCLVTQQRVTCLVTQQRPAAAGLLMSSYDDGAGLLMSSYDDDVTFTKPSTARVRTPGTAIHSRTPYAFCHEVHRTLCPVLCISVLSLFFLSFIQDYGCMDIASKTHKKIAIIIIINYYYQDSHTVSAFFFLISYSCL